MAQIKPTLRTSSTEFSTPLYEIRRVKVTLAGGFNKEYEFSCPDNISFIHAAGALAIIEHFVCFQDNFKRRNSYEFFVQANAISTDTSEETYCVSLNVTESDQMTSRAWVSFFNSISDESTSSNNEVSPPLKAHFKTKPQGHLIMDQTSKCFNALKEHPFFPKSEIHFSAADFISHPSIILYPQVIFQLSELLTIQNCKTTDVKEIAPRLFEIRSNRLTIPEFLSFITKLAEGFSAVEQHGYNLDKLTLFDIGFELSSLNPCLLSDVHLEAKPIKVDELSEIDRAGMNVLQSLKIQESPVPTDSTPEARTIQFLGQLIVQLSGECPIYFQERIDAIKGELPEKPLNVERMKEEVSHEITKFGENPKKKRLSKFATGTLQKMKPSSKSSSKIGLESIRQSQMYTSQVPTMANILQLCVCMLRHTAEKRWTLQQVISDLEYIQTRHDKRESPSAHGKKTAKHT
ncbi:MAG: hypothetical protein HAW66_10285 [Shewanella sp.]|nr:hypothetical protein [Shewanella sp.]